MEQIKQLIEHGFADGQRSLALGRNQDQFTGLLFRFELVQFVDFVIKVSEGTTYKIIGYWGSPGIGVTA